MQVETLPVQQAPAQEAQAQETSGQQAAPPPAASDGSAAAPPPVNDVEMKDAAPSAPEAAKTLPEDATETIYLNNLNEKVKIPTLKQTLKNLFKNYGPVLDVVAHRSVRMRGQAFVAFPEKEMAAKAVKEIKGFPLYGRPMEISFAKSRADAVVKRKAPEEFDSHKEERLKHKSRHPPLHAKKSFDALMIPTCGRIELKRKNDPMRKKYIASKEAARKAAGEAGPGAPLAPASRRIVQMPDEYLPPNKILFVQNLPETAGKDALEILFKQYPNLVEVRTIPGRSNIAFVEYTDATAAGVAKEALHNYKFDGESKIKVTYAKA